MKTSIICLVIRLEYFMKPNCFNLRLDRSKFKNGYYIVLMELAKNILGSTLLLPKQINRMLSHDWFLCFYLGWESPLGADERLVT